MPAPLLPKSELLARLSDTFRRLGYDGASITDIASATGLGKSSLYHYFPGGKEQMAADVLTDLAQALEANLFAPLSGAGRPDEKLKEMIETIDAFYDGGRKACLLERLAASAGRNNLQAPLRALFLRWMKAMESLCRDAGIPAATARIRAEDALVRIEGSLVLAAGMNDIKPFARALTAIRKSLLADD